ncbi:hypothetical protein JKP88DRAFT_304662, partial [Tribonema minus]
MCTFTEGRGAARGSRGASQASVPEALRETVVGDDVRTPAGELPDDVREGRRGRGAGRGRGSPGTAAAAAPRLLGLRPPGPAEGPQSPPLLPRHQGGEPGPVAGVDEAEPDQVEQQGARAPLPPQVPRVHQQVLELSLEGVHVGARQGLHRVLPGVRGGLLLGPAPLLGGALLLERRGGRHQSLRLGHQQSGRLGGQGVRPRPSRLPGALRQHRLESLRGRH